MMNIDSAHIIRSFIGGRPFSVVMERFPYYRKHNARSFCKCKLCTRYQWTRWNLKELVAFSDGNQLHIGTFADKRGLKRGKGVKGVGSFLGEGKHKSGRRHMRQIGWLLGFGGLLALLVALATPEVSAQKKKDAKSNERDKYPAATDVDYKAIQKQKNLIGKLVSLDSNNVTLRVEYPHYEANPKYKPPKVTNPKAANYNAAANQQYQMWKTYNDLTRQQAKAAQAKNSKEYQRAMQRISQDMARLQQQITQLMFQGAAPFDPNNPPFIVVTNTKDFDLEVEEKVVCRRLFLPVEYDDTGNIKKFTDKEKAELRGDDKTKPGYAAKLEDFQAGQELKIYLTAPKKVEKDKDADKDKETDKDAKVPEEVLRPTANMVVMTKDAPSTTSPGDDNKKKKK
jgi:hypothetical protein